MVQYAELYCRSNFSFLQGASHPDELVAQAAALGYQALAITDRNTLAGIVRAHVAARQHHLPLIVGAELEVQHAPTLVLWAPDRGAYGRLCRLITAGRRRAPKGAFRLYLEDLEAAGDGLLAGMVWEDPWHPPDHAVLERLKKIFPGRLYWLVTLHRRGDEALRLEAWASLARRTAIAPVAAGDVRYHLPGRLPLYETLTAIRLGTTVDRLGPHRPWNAQHHLRTLEELQALYGEYPEMLERTVEIARQCRFCLEELRYEYPEELVPRGMDPWRYLARLAWRGALRRYPRGVPRKVRQLLQHELALIRELHYEAYFLTVWDLVRFARSRGILCQGRGSAANSAVCFCLGITSVDPDRIDVLFERFVSRQRNEAPDIDVDFEHHRREEVIQYIYRKYGRHRAGMTATVITYRSRSAIRDVGKALGVSPDRIDALARQVEGFHYEPHLADRMRQVGIDPHSPLGVRWRVLVEQLIGFPRHLSQHVGGMVITRGPLCELCPIENAAMEGRTVIQWDKDDLDELGILKVDCLALGMLTAIHQCLDLVARHHGRRLSMTSIPPEDPRVYDMICRADTVGVFQIESRAQMSMLPRLRPRCFYDLVIEVAIVRPGPIQGQMVHPYLRRRAGLEPVHYPNEAIRQVLHKTLGVPIFQEQAMRLAVVAAGFTPEEADQLRRAMGAWRRPGLIDQFRRKLVDGMVARGLSREFALQVFQQIRGFGEYGFPESHAASFALLVYVSAWLKCYYPAAFTAALLNSQPMGFYAPAQLVADARRHGVVVRPVDVNASQWECTLEEVPPRGRKAQPALRLGLSMVWGLPRWAADRLLQARQEGPFSSLEDLLHRTHLPRHVLLSLARADALASLGLPRRQAIWHILALEDDPQQRPLLFLPPPAPTPPEPALPPMSAQQEVIEDYRTVQLSLRAHPVSFYRPHLQRLGVTTARALQRRRHGQPVRVAGLVLLRQRPSTARGITFVTLEDETGTVNLVVYHEIWQRFAQVARTASAWLVDGKVQRQGPVIHVVASRLHDLTEQLQRVPVRSRDFR